MCAHFAAIDPRLGETQFRRFEPLLASALSRWPATTSFTPPEGMACSTFVARFRDVLSGYRLHSWPTSLFDPALFRAIDGKFVLRHDHATSSCIFDHKQKNGRPPLDTSHATPTTSSSSALGPYKLTPEQLHAFCVLLNSSLLPGATILLQDPPPVDLSPFPNVILERGSDGLWLLL